MNTKRRPWILVLILIIIGSIGIAGSFALRGEREAGEAVRIGVVLPLTGDLANFGKTVLNGVQLGVDDFLKDNPNIVVRLISEDSQAKPAVAVSAFQKLIDVNEVRIVIGELTSSSTLAMAPIAQQRKVLLLSPTASNPKLSAAGPYFFRVWPSDSFDGRVAAEYCFRKLGFRKAGIIFINNDYGLGLKDVFSDTFSRLGGEVVLADSYLENTTDFRTLLTKANQKGLDVLYLPGHPQGIGTILKQARELDVNTAFFSNVAAEDKEFLSIAGNATEGLYFTAPAFSVEAGGPVVRRFVDEYRRRFSETPDVHAVKGHEAATVLLTAVHEGARTAEETMEFLQRGRVFNCLSGDLRFDRNGDVITAMSVKRYAEDGGAQLLQTIIPEGAE